MSLPTLDPTRLHRLQEGALAVRSQPAVLEVTGPGALACLQGLLTNDLERPGDGSLVYGALLTPKGAIVVDLWVLRTPGHLLLLAEPEARQPALELLRRSLPPRLATVTDRTGDLRVAWLYGLAQEEALSQARLVFPEEGRVVETGALLLGRAPAAAPFRGLLVGPEPELVAVLEATALPEGNAEDQEAARILAGWPRLGAEIQERTLVQEVRFDEIGGVSYTKGCYTGQETVARLHFRGHVNRELRGLAWDGLPTLTDRIVVEEGGGEVGRIRSLLAVPGWLLGLALLRREIEPGSRVIAGGREATVVSLPFDEVYRQTAAG